MPSASFSRELPAWLALVNVNQVRDWRPWLDWDQRLMRKARPPCAKEDLRFDIDKTIDALDPISVALSFPWADFRRTQPVIKMQTRIDLRGSFRLDDPVFKPGGFAHKIALRKE